MNQGSGFEDKLLARLDKLDPDQIQSYLARLLGQKQFLETTFDHLDEGIVVTDAALRVLFINPRARAMLGLARGRTLVGEDLAARIGSGHPLAETITSLRLNPRPIEGYECSIGGRPERTLSLTTLPMRDPAAGEGSGAELLILILRDVTDRVQRESEKARARRLASMATLTSGIAHEIKNPLNAINIHAQLLQGELDKARASDGVADLDRLERAGRVILEETGRLARIVDEFLLAARPRRPQLEPSELNDLLGQLERIFRPECERAGIELRLAADHELPPVMLDPHLMLQALRNLVRNAIDALIEQEREQAPPECIAVEARLATDGVSISVQDNGPGIPDKTLEHIFEPYYTTKASGTGLGLMVVYRIVAEHGGALHVDTRPGEGSRFIITLPLHNKPVRLLGHDHVVGAPVVLQGKPLTEAERDRLMSKE